MAGVEDIFRNWGIPSQPEAVKPATPATPAAPATPANPFALSPEKEKILQMLEGPKKAAPKPSGPGLLESTGKDLIDALTGRDVAPPQNKEVSDKDFDYAQGLWEFLKGIPAGLAASFPSSAHGILELSRAGLTQLGVDPSDTKFLKDAGDEMVRWIQHIYQKGWLAPEKGYGTTTSRQVGEAIGSMLSIMATAGTGAAIKGAAKAPKLAKLGGRLMPYAFSMGLGAHDQAMRIAQALQEGKEVTDSDRVWSLALGGVVGLSELWVPSRINKIVTDVLKPLPKNMPLPVQRNVVGRVMEAITRATRSGGKIGADAMYEGLQESLASIAQDMISKGFYNPELKAGQSMLSDFTAGAGAAGILRGILEAATGAKRRAHLSRTQKDIAQKLTEARKKQPEEPDQQPATQPPAEIVLSPPKPLTPQETESAPQFAQRIIDTNALRLPNDDTLLRPTENGYDLVMGDTVVAKDIADKPFAELLRSKMEELRPEIVRQQDLYRAERQKIGDSLSNYDDVSVQDELKQEQRDILNPYRFKREELPDYVQIQIDKHYQGKRENTPDYLSPGDMLNAGFRPDLVDDMIVEKDPSISKTGWVAPEHVEAKARQSGILPDSPVYKRIVEHVTGKRTLKDATGAQLQAAYKAFENEGIGLYAGDPLPASLDYDQSGDDYRQVRDKVAELKGSVTIPQIQRITGKSGMKYNRDMRDLMVERGDLEKRGGKYYSPARPRRDAVVTEEPKPRQLPKGVQEAISRHWENQTGGAPVTIQMLREADLPPDARGKGAEGSYNNGVLTLVEDANADKMTEEQMIERFTDIVNHEFIHKLRESDLLTDEEFYTGLEFAKERMHPDGTGTFYERAQKLYRNQLQNETDIQEEAVAEAYRQWVSKGKNLKMKPPVQRVFHKIARFIRNFVRSISSLNARYDNVFEAIRSGEVGRRSPEEVRAVLSARPERLQEIGYTPVPAQSRPVTRTAAQPPRRGPAGEVRSRQRGAAEAGADFLPGHSTGVPRHSIQMTERFSLSNVRRVPMAVELADAYRKSKGIEAGPLEKIHDPPTDYLRRIADYQDTAENQPMDPAVVASYNALIAETADQYRALGDLQIEPYRGQGEPYRNSQEMLDDVANNGHLWFFITENGFGESADPSEHPLLAETEFKTVDGQTMLANDIFRVVHDFFGHAQTGLNFGPTGEYNAFHEHARMFSSEAIPALAAETLAQNAWVNFGPHLRREDGSLPRKGERDYVPLPERPFSEQKAHLIPTDLLAEDPMPRTKERYALTSASDPLYQRVVDIASNEIPGLTRYLPYLTRSDMRELFSAKDGVIKNRAKKLVDAISDLPSAEEFAAVAYSGRAKRGWYHRSSKAISEVFGLDAPRFTALLASLSPQASVEANLNNALKVWRDWVNAGRPTLSDTDMNGLASLSGPARTARLLNTQLGRIINDAVVVNEGSDVMSAYLINGIRSLTTDAPSRLQLSGPKVNSFMANLRGVVDEVTNDKWMANFALLEQTAFRGSKSKTDSISSVLGKTPSYVAYSAAVRKAAEIVSQETGQRWTPREVQETVWSWAKALYEMKPGRAGAPIMDILYDSREVQEALTAVPDFATQFVVGANALILNEAGYGNALEALNRKLSSGRGGDRGRGQRRRGVGPEGSSFTERRFWAGVSAAADRLDQLWKINTGEVDVAPDIDIPGFEDARFSLTNYVHRDNPGGEWLTRQQENANRRAQELPDVPTAANKMSGSVTATIGQRQPVDLSPRMLVSLPGLMGEHYYRGRSEKTRGLEKAVAERGWRPEYPIMIMVNHEGKAFIGEGNHRTQYAYDHGIKSIPVDIRYFNGGELAEGPFRPEVLAESFMPSTLVDKEDAPGKALFPLAEDRQVAKEPTERYSYTYNPDLRRAIMYHGGSRAMGYLSQADPYAYGDVYALHGPGLYLTDNFFVAQSYIGKSKGNADVFSIRLGEDVNLMDIDDMQYLHDMAGALRRHPKGNQIDFEGKTPKDLLNNFQKVIEAEAAKPGTDSWNRQMGEWSLLHDLLRERGFNGFRHTGGDIMGSVNHNVAVLFPARPGGFHGAVVDLEIPSPQRYDSNRLFPYGFMTNTYDVFSAPGTLHTLAYVDPAEMARIYSQLPNWDNWEVNRFVRDYEARIGSLGTAGFTAFPYLNVTPETRYENDRAVQYLKLDKVQDDKIQIAIAKVLSRQDGPVPLGMQLPPDAEDGFPFSWSDMPPPQGLIMPDGSVVPAPKSNFWPDGPKTKRDIQPKEIGPLTEEEAEPHKPDRYSLSTEEQASYDRMFGGVPQRPVTERMLDRLNYPVSKGGFETVRRWFRQRFVNEADSLVKQTQELHREGVIDDRELMADYSAYGAYAQSKRSMGILAATFRHGIPVYSGGYTKVESTGIDGEPIDGLIGIMKRVINEGVTREFGMYAVAVRAQRLKREDRENLLTDEDIAIGLQQGEKFPWFEEVRQQYQRWNEGIVEFMIDTGVVDRELGDYWRQWGDYIPFYREADGLSVVDASGNEVTYNMTKRPGGRRMFAGLVGVKVPPKLKGGSDRLKGDVIELMIENARAGIEMGLRNVAAQRALRDSVRLGAATEIKRSQFDAAVGDVMIRVAGKEKFFRVADPWVLETLKNMAPADFGAFVRIMGMPANFLREMITKDPGFMMANLMRDTLSAWVTSGRNFTPLIGSLRGAASRMGGGAAEQLERAGVYGGHDFVGDMKKASRSFKRSAGRNPIWKIWETAERATELSDAATRAAVYRDVLKRTGNEAQALHESLEIINFSRRGNSEILRVITSWVPFLNARIQGLDVLWRAFAGTSKGEGVAYRNIDAKMKKRRAITRGLMLLGLTMAYYSMVSDTDEWKGASDEERDGNWLIPIGNGKYLKYPIPFEIGVIFKTIPERIMANISGKDTSADLKDAFIRNTMATLSMNPIPQAALPIIEAIANHSFYRDTSIEPYFMTDQHVSTRYTTGTSDISKFLGPLIGVPPVRLDHVIKGYGGTIGTYGLIVLDMAVRGISGAPERKSWRLEDYPVVRRILSDQLQQRGQVDRFYEMADATRSIARSVSALLKQGNVEGARDLLKNKTYRARYEMNRVMEGLRRQMAEVNAAERAIAFSATMTGDEKLNRIKELRAIKTRLASQIKTVRERVMAIP